MTGWNIMNEWLQWIVVIFDIIAGIGFLCFLGFAGSSSVFSYVYRVAVWIGAVGLLFQAWRTLDMFLTGGVKTDFFAPFWILKDIGYWVLFVVMMVQSFRSRGWCPNERNGICLKSDVGRKVASGKKVCIEPEDIGAKPKEGIRP